MARKPPKQQLIGEPEPDAETQDGTQPAVVGTGEDTTKAEYLPSNQAPVTGKDELDAQHALAGSADGKTDTGNIERGADDPTHASGLESAQASGSNVGALTSSPVDKESEYADHLLAKTYLTSTDLDYVSAMPGQYSGEVTRLLNIVAEKAYHAGVKDGTERESRAQSEGYAAGYAAARAQFTPG